MGQIDISAADDISLHIPMDVAEKFTFTISLANQYFENFTQLPIEKKESKIYYFNNLNENINNEILSIANANAAGGLVSEN